MSRRRRRIRIPSLIESQMGTGRQTPPSPGKPRLSPLLAGGWDYFRGRFSLLREIPDEILTISSDGNGSATFLQRYVLASILGKRRDTDKWCACLFPVDVIAATVASSQIAVNGYLTDVEGYDIEGAQPSSGQISVDGNPTDRRRASTAVLVRRLRHHTPRRHGRRRRDRLNGESRGFCRQRSITRRRSIRRRATHIQGTTGRRRGT
ncbi:hypothetical protein NDU88_000217 [Pleurodeles waltl]|uniref:Uncharacterized protein n=1 Tax=Pleurodeles waltl TaxID=8319 RepID=A0AAV7Q079_PLEWA|nr:hypothetical protein NDU88_000217 [Pleurodeles waltl]